MSKYQPSDLQVGGARLSVSMLTTWSRCRAEWFYNYLCPHPTQPNTAGFTTFQSSEATLGSAVHAGLEAYRLSGWRDGEDSGEYNLGFAIDAALTYLRDSTEDFTYLNELEEKCILAEKLIKEYDRERPGSLTDWRLLGDPTTGAPLVEHEYAIPLLGGRFQFTVKTDAIGIRQNPRAVRAVDLKTKSYRYVNDFIRGASLNGQGWSEVSVLHVHLPHLPIDGMQYEIIIKDRGSKSSYPTIEVAEVLVTPKQVVRWLSTVERWALEISWHVAEWQSLVGKGVDPYEAGAQVFTRTGQLSESNACARYGRMCDFAPTCESIDDRGATPTLMEMEPRTLVEETTSEVE